MTELSRSSLRLINQPLEHEMVGHSPAMLELFRNIRKLSSAGLPILITGESGTGKELAAIAIHERSKQCGAFIPINCGALPSNLIQSELFGYEKGAFTGAYERKIGLIESSDGGTIFLDEIGDLSLELQVNLLRVLQEGKLQRVGGVKQIPFNARIIAATHSDIEKSVADGLFREDLYYRLNVLRLHVPALRERNSDIELLARFLFEKFSLKTNTFVKRFSRQTINVLNQHNWPGNVRELINRIRRALVMSDHRLLLPTDLGLEQETTNSQIMTLEEARVRAEKQVIQTALRFSRKNLSSAARELDVSRTTLYRLMEKTTLRLDSFKHTALSGPLKGLV